MYLKNKIKDAFISRALLRPFFVIIRRNKVRAIQTHKNKKLVVVSRANRPCFTMLRSVSVARGVKRRSAAKIRRKGGLERENRVSRIIIKRTHGIAKDGESKKTNKRTPKK